MAEAPAAARGGDAEMAEAPAAARDIEMASASSGTDGEDEDPEEEGAHTEEDDSDGSSESCHGDLDSGNLQLKEIVDEADGRYLCHWLGSDALAWESPEVPRRRASGGPGRSRRALFASCCRLR